MNKLHLTAGLTLSAAAIGLGGNIAGAQEVGDGNADIRAELADYMRDQAVEAGVLDCDISPSIVNLLGDNVVKIVQRELSEEGYFRGGIDNKLGKETCKDIHQFQDDFDLFVDGEVGYQVIGALGIDPNLYKREKSNSNNNSVKAKEKKASSSYSVEDCNKYDVWSMDTIKAVQKALGVTTDGDFGSETCNAMIKHQESNDIAQYGKGFLGRRTMDSLGIKNPSRVTDSSNNKSFDPESDCPTSSSCEILKDLTTQTGYVKVNDWNDTTVNGRTLFSYSIQSGKPGTETDTGLFRLGRIEYGENYNPWRTSTLGSSDGLPNLYKFRRHVPVNGGWSGEGTHGSRAFGYGKGSSGCARTSILTMDTLAKMPTGTLLLIRGSK